MTKAERWLMISVAFLAAFLYFAFPRYELQFRDGAVLRWDRWTGHLDASTSLKDAPWATVTIAPAVPKPNTARFEDIESVLPAAKKP